jgi:hypothetical protein
MALGFLWGGAGQSTTARADIIRIDDLTEGPPTVTAFDNQGNPLRNPPITNLTASSELLSFDYTSPGGPFGASAVFYHDFLEPPSSNGTPGAVSDRFILTVTQGSPDYHVEFSSDPTLLPVPIGATKFADRVEDGTFQGEAKRVDSSGMTIDLFEARSDVDAVPEPSTLSLFVLGGLTLAGHGWWRRQRKWLAMT